MAMLKNSQCRECGKKYSWVIARPGDGHWDRWTNDDGETLANWFITNNLCWEHAFAKMPERFAKMIKTLSYEEEEQTVTVTAHDASAEPNKHSQQ